MEENTNDKEVSRNSASYLDEIRETFGSHAIDADDAMRAFESIGGEKLELDAATSKRLLRRIDLIMMPILCVVYGLNYLDKTTLSYASIMGLQKDIGLVGDNYQWLGSVFYFGKKDNVKVQTWFFFQTLTFKGYLGWEMPAGRLLQRLPLAKYNGFCIVMWGMTLACFAAVNDFQGAVALRFFLGVLEASVTPGFTLMTSQWYTKNEQAARIAIWVSFNGFAQIFGGTVAYGIASGNSRHSFTIAPWKIMFLFTGLLTVFMGLVFLSIIPDSQLNAWWLNPQDKVLAVERVRTNQQGIGNKHFKKYQFQEALMDPLTWAFFVLAVAADITNGGLSNFFSQLIVSFGFTTEQSLLYGTPAGAVEVISLLAWGLISQHWGNRILWSVGGVGASLVGSILIVALPLDMRVGRLIGYYLTTASVTGFVAALSLVSSNIAG
ncbi:hypothetical protein MMC17_006551 [Xylographa soralifera]|nr:hypothetical protein [Xylographa soralifera]